MVDFIDEAGVKELYDTVKASMDRCQLAKQTFGSTSTALDQRVQDVLKALEPTIDELEQHQAYHTTGPSPVPDLFNDLENHATMVASHLEGLVKHYDLCMLALKHTEGAGEAMGRVSDDDTHLQDESKLAGIG